MVLISLSRRERPMAVKPPKYRSVTWGLPRDVICSPGKAPHTRGWEMKSNEK